MHLDLLFTAYFAVTGAIVVSFLQKGKTDKRVR
jgi:hypothetical protein